MINSVFCKPALAVVVVLALAGCKSDAERADEYFQSGIELLEAGDTDRALVEFRNVLEFDNVHQPTREAMATLFLEQGNPRAAYQQYLVIAEQYPEEFEARRILAELAFESASWEEYVRHGTVAIELSPEDPRVQAISFGMQYRDAVLEEDDPARMALVAPAEALLETLPDNIILNNLLTDSYTRDGNFSKAQQRLAEMTEAAPDNRQLYDRQLAILAQQQDFEAIEAHLLTMIERFPDDREVQGMLLRYYVSVQQRDKAEAFLREISDPSDEDPGLFLSLIQFLAQTKGADAARVEIERGIAESPSPNRFKAMLAMMDFQAGNADKAVADLEAALAASGAEDADTTALKTTLARLFVNTGNQVGARRLVEEVLEQDSANTDALKMQAAWNIQADETDEAIANLRLVLDTSPEDVQAMSMMYEAYTRAGEPDLARDFLALAVDASNNAPDELLRYARVLIQEERYLPAEDVLLPALRQAPQNVDLLGALGELYLRLEDVPRATQVVDTLERIDTERSKAVGVRLQAEILSRENGVEEALQFLEGIASGENADLRAQVTLLQARMSTGDWPAALSLAEELVIENPDSLGLKQVLARTQAASGDLDGAEETLRDIIAAAPAQAVNAWLELAGIVRRQGDQTKAAAVIDDALEATGNNPNILWAKASLLERDGDYDGAIAIYEDLYVANSSSVVIANNLASMLTTYRGDPESLDRAWTIARRLRDAEVPAFQDTYGWLLFRRGNPEEALPYLESAAAGLPDDPVVQVHLGLAYAALERNEQALAQIQKAVDFAGPADTRSSIEEARAELIRLRGLVEN